VTTTHRDRSRRRLDLASLLLLVTSLASGVFAYWLVMGDGINAIVMIPSIAAATVAATHITKREAPH
jgi:NhaP-type Na+/H+ or K+/H+ antiporter